MRVWVRHRRSQMRRVADLPLCKALDEHPSALLARGVPAGAVLSRFCWPWHAGGASLARPFASIWLAASVRQLVSPGMDHGGVSGWRIATSLAVERYACAHRKHMCTGIACASLSPVYPRRHYVHIQQPPMSGRFSSCDSLRLGPLLSKPSSVEEQVTATPDSVCVCVVLWAEML